MTLTAPLSEKTKRKGSWLFTCLVKAPFGCMAYFAGFTLVLLWLVGSTLGPELARQYVEHFDATYAGELELGTLRFPEFFEEQRADGIVLRDPEGDEVLHGELSFPRFGPGVAAHVLSIHLRKVSLAFDGAGALNLARALVREAVPDPLAIDIGGLRFEVDCRIDKLVLRDERSPGVENELVLRDLAGGGDVRSRDGLERLDLALSGVVDGASEPVELTLAIDDLEAVILGNGSSPWFLRTRIPGCPAGAAGIAGGLARRAFGPRIDLLELTALFHPTRGLHLSLRALDEGTTIDFAGTISADGERFEGAAQESLSIACPLESWWMLGGPGRCVPLLERARATEPGVLAQLRLERFRLPLDGALERLSGDLFVELPASRVAFPGVLWEALDAPAPGEDLLVNAPRFRVAIRDGVTDYAGIEFTTERGVIALSGTGELGSGETSLRVHVERSVFGASADARFALGGPLDALTVDPDGKAADGENR